MPLLYCSRCALSFSVVVLMTIIWVPDSQLFWPWEVSRLCFVRDWAHFRPLDDHISNCHHLACVGYVHQVSVVSFSVTHKLSFQCLGFKFADVSVPLPHEDCATKNIQFTNWKLRFYTSHQLCWASFFSSSHKQVSDPCCLKNFRSPHHLGKSWVNEQTSCHLQ